MLILRLLLLLTICFSCSSENHVSDRVKALKDWKAPNDKVKVLSTTGMINDLVKAVGQDRVDTLILIQGELDPHSYQLVKGDDEKFSFAHIIFYNGLGLEHSPSIVQRLTSSSKAIGLGNEVLSHFPDRILYYNGQLDPHLWMDISLWAEAVPFIVAKLSENAPAHAEEFKQNGEKLIQELMQVHQEIYESMMSIPHEKRYLVTSHDAFNYFTRAYLASHEERNGDDWQKRFSAPEGLAPESQLSSTDIQQILDHSKRHNIQILFAESNLSKASLQKITSAGQEKGLNIVIADTPLYADAMGKEGSSGDTYVKMMRHNAAALQSWWTNSDE